MFRNVTMFLVLSLSALALPPIDYVKTYSVSSVVQLQGIPPGAIADAREDGDLAIVDAISGKAVLFRFDATSTASAVSNFIVVPTRGNGRWIAMQSVGALATTSYSGYMSAADKTKLDSVTASAAALSSTLPVDVGTAAIGDGTTAARSNHVHGHGNLAGGSFHAAAIAAGASGFMTGADKTKLDGVEALADVTDAANVASAGAVMDGDFAANGALLRSDVGVYTTTPLTTVTSTGAGSAGYLLQLDNDGKADGRVLSTDGTKLDGIESGADNVSSSSVLAALAEAATAKDMGTGAITNVGLVDGRDVSTDGTALDVLSALSLSANRLVDFPVSITAPVLEAGLWTTSVASSKLNLNRTAGVGEADAAWLEFSSVYRTGASDGVNFTGAVVHYFVSTAAADDIRFEFYINTFGADNSGGTSTIVAGQTDGHYDAAHDTGAERGDWPGGGPHFHTSTITFPSALNVLANEFVTVRVFFNADVAGLSVFSIIGVNMVGYEKLTPD